LENELFVVHVGNADTGDSLVGLAQPVRDSSPQLLITPKPNAESRPAPLRAHCAGQALGPGVYRFQPG
jgi:hypothetical protein